MDSWKVQGVCYLAFNVGARVAMVRRQMELDDGQGAGCCVCGDVSHAKMRVHCAQCGHFVCTPCTAGMWHAHPSLPLPGVEELPPMCPVCRSPLLGLSGMHKWCCDGG